MPRPLGSTWYEVDGLRLHTLVGGERGAGRLPVVLVHGAAVSSLHMKAEAESKFGM